VSFKIDPPAYELLTTFVVKVSILTKSVAFLGSETNGNSVELNKSSTMYLPDFILLKVTSTLVAVGVLITVPSIFVVVPTILRNALTGVVNP
jgi:hypothetical protein